ncbi:MAG: N-6 DNA methylase [Nitrososphaerota archaeon]|nr:N-6 DNA methylase [Nitrososphaerota archaeon]
MIPKPTENTVTGILREELEKRGVKTSQFVSLDTPLGRREIDLLCSNGGLYPIEAKFTEAQLLDAIAKVQNDYLKHYKILGIRGGFAVLYPRDLARPMPIDAVKEMAVSSTFKLIAMFPPDDSRPFTVHEGNLTDVADILANYILLPPKPVEPSIPYIIKALRETANYIVAGLQHLSGKSLKEFFGGENVFRNILQYEEGEYPEEDLRLAASYILVNQLLFYHVLSRTKKDQFDVIDPEAIKEPRQLEDYFRKVLDVNYKAVFGFKVASLIPPRFNTEVRRIISVIQGLAPEKVGGDLLGTIFHDLIPFDVRKRVAAFYTNVLAAELLASLAIDDPRAKVADFAVGSGGLLVAAYRRKRELLRRPMTQRDHKLFVEEDLYGVDVMPFAANIAACHLALQSPQFLTDRVNIAIWDATDLKPGIKIPSVADVTTFLTGQSTLDILIKEQDRSKGIVKLRDESATEGVELQPVDVVIMNPPFTRQERIPEEYKRILVERFKGEYGRYLHGQLGYHGYFILLADKFLKEGGRMALVLPATVLRIRSCEGIRKLWAERYHVEHIITTWHRSAFSESAKFREILLVAKKGQSFSNRKTVITVLKKRPKTPKEAREIAELISQADKDRKDEKIILKIYDYSTFRSDVKNWFKWISVSNLSLMDLMEVLLKSDKLAPLTTIAEAQRIDLEHLKFKNFHAFILHDSFRARKRNDLWIMDQITENELITRNIKLEWRVSLPLRALGRGLRRLSYVDTIDVTDNADYLILSWFDKLRDLASPLLNTKELEKLDSKVIRSWKNKFESRKSNVILGRRFDISAPGTSLIAFYSKNPIVGADFWSIKNIESDYGKVLTLWLNSTINLLQVFILRTETRGAWMKIHDYMLEELLVPKPHELSEIKYSELIDVFEQVKNARFPSILKQLKDKNPLRRLIDETCLSVLGYRGNSTQLLDKLYESLANEIIILKKMMSEKA